MRRRNNEKSKFIILIALLFVLALGIGYAVLTEKLTINNTISYDSMKWDVGFSKIEDHGGTITSTSAIGSDGKSITVNCDFGTSINQETCIVKATITNNGTFNVALTEDPIITYDDTYIHTLTFKWNNHPTYENHTVLKDNFIAKGESEEVILTIKTKFLNVDTLPTEETSIPITINLDLAEWQGGDLPTKEDLAILSKSCVTASGTSSFLNDPTDFELTYSNNSVCELMEEKATFVKNITFEDSINIPADSVGVMDLSEAGNESIIASYVINEEYTTDSETFFDVYIQSDSQIYANEDMSWWFLFPNLKKINGLELVDTSMTTNMEGMFGMTGLAESVFELDISSLDTSNVTNMSRMFSGTGLYSESFTLDVSNLDTSNVTDMRYMFDGIGAYSTILEIDVSNFDTRKVTNMRGMFHYAGFKSQLLKLDVSNFVTSNVTDMSYMFRYAGYESTSFTLDLSNFNTSKVTDMYAMLYYTGFYSTKFITTITISNPNLSSYNIIVDGVATKGDSKATINYTSATEAIVDKIITDKYSESNVVKGVKVG